MVIKGSSLCYLDTHTFFVPLLNRVEDLQIVSLSSKKLSAVASETTEQTRTVTQANSPSLTGETWKEKPVM